MLTSSWIRGLSILSLALFSSILPRTDYLSFFFACALGHYALAFIYSKNQIISVLRAPKTYVALIFLVVSSVLIIWFRIPSLFIYFGLHHILSEMYFMSQQTEGLRYSNSLKVTRFLLNTFTYLFMMRFYFGFSALLSLSVILVLILTYLAFIFYLYCERKNVKLSVLADQNLFEIMGIAAALSTLFIPFEFRTIIFYHGLFWFYLGFVKSANRGVGTVLNYLGITVLVSGIFYLFTPTMNLPWQASLAFLNGQVELWGYIHISASFAFSAFNPSWISRYFFLIPNTRFRLAKPLK